MRLKLGIGSEGRVVLPQRDAEALGVADGDEVEVHTVRGAFTLAVRPGGSAQAYFAGSLSALTVPEVFHLVFSSLKTGVLLLSFGGEVERQAEKPLHPQSLRRKSIFFRDGQVVFGSSSDRADRLGAILWREGQVRRQELERCGRLVQAGRPLGQVLVDEGILTSGQLYSAMTLQVREIALGAFLEREGTFSFVEGSFDEKNAVKLPEKTRDLLLEGIKRVEEMERISQAEVPDWDAPVRPTGRRAEKLGPAGERLLEVADGKRSVRQAVEESQLGLYQGVRTLAELVRRGLVHAMEGKASPGKGEEEVFSVSAGASAAPAAAARAGGPFETYRRIFQLVYAELSKHRKDSSQRLNSYFDKLPDSQRPLFQGVRIEADGDIDAAQVLVNVGHSGHHRGAAARARALEALEALLAFALFEVKNCLPRAEAEALLRTVGRMQVGKA